MGEVVGDELLAVVEGVDGAEVVAGAVVGPGEGEVAQEGH